MVSGKFPSASVPSFCVMDCYREPIPASFGIHASRCTYKYAQKIANKINTENRLTPRIAFRFFRCATTSTSGSIAVRLSFIARSSFFAKQSTFAIDPFFLPSFFHFFHFLALMHSKHDADTVHAAVPSVLQACGLWQQ